MNHPNTESRTASVACLSRDTLSDLTLGKLPAETIEKIGSHIETCTICQGILDTLDGLEDSVVKDLRSASHGQAEQVSSELERQLQQAEAISHAVWRELETEGESLEEMPSRLGQYELLERLGQGGMGVVYRATHTRLKRPVAVKVLRRERLRDPESITRFHREMEAVGQLDHPHLVRAHDAGEAEGEHYLVMEFLDGVDLARLVRRSGPLLVADACEVVRQAALGLQYAHEHGLVHRDVKPSNLMLTTGGQVKVLDLGLARLSTDTPGDEGMTTTGQVLGTGDFMAPEQGQDTRQADARSDIYSLGCTFFFLLAGQAPFSSPERDTLLKKVLAHLQESVPPLGQFRQDLPEAIDAILKRMLAKAPSDRYATALEVADVLQPLAAGHALADVMTRGQRTLAGQHWDTLVGRAASAPCSEPSSSLPKVSTRQYWAFVAAGTITVLLGTVLYCYAPLAMPFGSKGAVAWDRQSTMDAVSRQDERPPVAAHGAENRTGVGGLSDASPAQAAVDYITHADLPGQAREAMLTVLRQHPSETRWSGRCGATVFAVAVKRLPQGDRHTQGLPILMNFTHLLALQELLKGKSLLDRYAEHGLTDATTLRQAVVRAAGGLSVTGKVQGCTHQTAVDGNAIVGYVLADESSLVTHLLQPAELATVKAEYREVMHQQARELMERGNWKDALLLWQHLHKRRLVSRGLYLDAARCFKELGQEQDLVRVLDEAIEAFAREANAEWLEQVGDLALTVPTPLAQEVACKAYRAASEKLYDSVSR